ncbi:MAG: hypothetical protein ACYST0_07350 [Planctomycetota bacterium]
MTDAVKSWPDFLPTGLENAALEVPALVVLEKATLARHGAYGLFDAIDLGFEPDATTTLSVGVGGRCSHLKYRARVKKKEERLRTLRSELV